MAKKEGLESYIISRKERVFLARILPDPDNVRDKYSRESLVVLADSIARNGQLQPALMESSGAKYSIVAGHRRYWASMLAVEVGWMDRKYMLGKVVRKLPSNLRLRLQCAENEFKEPVAKDNLANIFWERYKLTLIDQVKEISEGQKDIIHLASNFSEIPKELRDNLPVSIYAKNMGFGESAVRKAFSYQMLNKSIRARVANPGDYLSYSAACTLSRIKDKNEQRRILKLVEEEGDATEFHVKTAVNQYFESIRQEEDTGSFMVIEGPSQARVGTLKELSIYLGKAEKLIRVLKSVKALVKGVENLEIRVNTHTTTPKKIIEGVYNPLSQIHRGFLANAHYKNIWKFVPKRLSLMDFIASNHKRTLAAGENVMDLVESKVVSISEIIANPLNPRGKERDFNKADLENLANSIERDGLVHDILVMEKGKGYVNLEGHRRHAAMQLLAERRKDLKIGILVIPALSEEQQVKLMCDANLFEQISLDAKARSIARQYVLDSKRRNNFKIKTFIKLHPEWSPRVIRNCIAYDSLSESVKKLQSQGLITYGAAIEISKIKNSEIQMDFAVSSAILRQRKYELKKAVELQDQDMLFDKKKLEDMRRQAELKTLASELESNLEGVKTRMERIVGGRLLNKFKKDDYLVHKFQCLMKTLEDAA